jgi:hypothetical protein
LLQLATGWLVLAGDRRRDDGDLELAVLVHARLPIAFDDEFGLCEAAH